LASARVERPGVFVRGYGSCAVKEFSSSIEGPEAPGLQSAREAAYRGEIRGASATPQAGMAADEAGSRGDPKRLTP
jgi:hypothetical protein